MLVGVPLQVSPLYMSSYYYMCVLIVLYTTIGVSSYYYILLYVCPHTSMIFGVHYYN
jgi:hypothetical protein